MKISELEKLLRTARQTHGDLEVWISGLYGSETDQIDDDLGFRADDPKKVWIRTDLETG